MFKKLVSLSGLKSKFYSGRPTQSHLPLLGFWAAIAAVIALKLWLVHDEEIIGSATQYDALWYVRSANHWYWGTPYHWTAFIRSCGYPLWIAVVHLLHLPLRLAIELLQIGGALVLTIGLRRVGVNGSIGVLSFAAICLHPAGYQLDDYTMSDTFYAGVLWYVLGGLLLTMTSSGFLFAAFTGVAIAILWNTREEGILLVAIVSAWSVICFLRAKRIHCSWSTGLRATAKLVLTTCLIAMLVIVGIYSINYSVFRSFARSEMTASAFQSLFHSLLRIKPITPKQYAPITTSTLSRAFRVSPTLAKLRPQFEGPIGESWRTETYLRVGLLNEIGAGWIVWATRQAASVHGYFATAEKAQRFFKKASHEINRACDDGRLPTRFAIDGFLDPLVQSGGVRALPHSAKRIAARFFGRWSVHSIVDDNILTAQEASLYDKMTLRRSAGVGPRKGAAFSLESFIGRYHFIAIIILQLVAVLAVAALFHSHRGVDSSPQFADAILLLGSAVLFRACLFTWLDATAFDGTEDRFLFPVLPLWTVVLALVAGWAFEAMRTPPLALEKR